MTTGSNLLPMNKRRTIARMYRRGDAQADIATSLGCTTGTINKHIRLYNTDPSYFSNLSREQYEARRSSSSSSGGLNWPAHPLRDFSATVGWGRRMSLGGAISFSTSSSSSSSSSPFGTHSPVSIGMAGPHEEVKRDRWRQQRHLTLKEQQARLAFARAHEHWTADDWKAVIFSGETIFYAGQWGDRHEFVREQPDGRIERLPGSRPRQPDEEEEEEETAAEKYASIAIVFWGGLCGNVQVGPYISEPEDKPLTKDDYLRLLDRHVRPVMGAGEAVVFEHTAAPIHRAAKVSDWLEEKDIPAILWPAKSHDMAIMDDVWAEMRRRLRDDYGYTTDRPRAWVAEALKMVWEDITHGFVQGLFEAMPGKMAALIESGGMTTKM